MVHIIVVYRTSTEWNSIRRSWKRWLVNCGAAARSRTAERAMTALVGFDLQSDTVCLCSNLRYFGRRCECLHTCVRHMVANPSWILDLRLCEIPRCVFCCMGHCLDFLPFGSAPNEKIPDTARGPWRSALRALVSLGCQLRPAEAGLLCSFGHSAIGNNAGNSFRLPMGLRLRKKRRTVFILCILLPLLQANEGNIYCDVMCSNQILHGLRNRQRCSLYCFCLYLTRRSSHK